MAKGDPKKPKGKMSAYAFFVQTCREEHKKKNPEVPVNFAEFSKKCSERWKTMSGKEKSKFDEMAKADKVRYDREMKDYGPAKGGKKKKDPNAPKRPPSGFFLFCSEFRPKIKSTNPGISIGDVQPYITKAAKLKEKYEKVRGLEASLLAGVCGCFARLAWALSLACFPRRKLLGRCSCFWQFSLTSPYV
ncbi:High mobility group protein B3 [Lemmus lemmus]